MTRPLPEVLALLDAPRVLVVGDIVLDRYLTGVVERISPEAPIQVLRVEREDARLGCGGSVAQMVAVLGAQTTLVGVVGDDKAAGVVQDLAARSGIHLDAVTEPGRRTGVKTRHLARSHSTDQQVLRVDEETTAPVTAATERALAETLEPHLASADAIIVSDYGKGALTAELLLRIVAVAGGRRVPVIADPNGDDFSRYRGMSCVTPNRPETRGATGIAVKDLATAEAAAAKLVTELELSFALITLDKEGMYLKESGAPGVHLTTTPREVFDVTGAGDMVVAVLGIALAAGASPLEAALLANVAAGLEVEHVGVVPITREEIAARLALGIEGLAAKHVCFDILHAGHVRYLAEAKAQGDVLIVGLNSDASVGRIKGAGRPLNAQADRVDVLAALAAVDHVVVFEEDVPTPLIADGQPDVLVQGMDWKDKGVEGREIVEARGGKVVLVDFHEGRSTTGLVQRIRGS